MNAKRSLRLVGSVVVALALPLTLGVPAFGGGGGGDFSPLPPTGGSDASSPDPGASSGSTPGDTGGDHGQVGGCSVVAVPTYLGVACSGAKDRDGKTVAEILGKDPVPDCWDDPVSDTELAAMALHNEPGPAGYTYYWERCLSGIDKDTKKVEPGGIKIDITLQKIDNGDEVKHLTDNQAALVQGYEGNKGVPSPLAGVTPSSHPHVGQSISFVDASPDEVVVPAGAVTLRAHITSIDVKPLGAGEDTTITCPGTGVRAESGDTPDSRPDGCWYKYEHSSADEPDEAYPVLMTANWTVDTSVGGGAWTYFTSFTKSQVTNVPVTEIQTLVVD